MFLVTNTWRGKLVLCVKKWCWRCGILELDEKSDHQQRQRASYVLLASWLDSTNCSSWHMKQQILYWIQIWRLLLLILVWLDPDSSNNVLFLMDPTGILPRVKIFLVINYTVYHHSYTDSYMVRKTRILSKRN